jgi:alpha-amylase/alpha-mannosidase (GH57 family)
MPKKPLYVAFLWHMHQPDYRTSLTGETHLPWTRFHAVKDYYDMGALIEKADGVHATINVVPSLMDQLIAYADGSAREAHAKLTLRDASELKDHEKAFLLRSFFRLTPKYMIDPYPRYQELLQRRGKADETGAYPTGLKTYTVQDYRDLQVWYNLTWCGQEMRRDPEIAALFQQGRGFSESDKCRLLGIQYAFIGRVLPYYRRLSESEKIELSISPYYHPILPLLCDLRSARESLPYIQLPPNPYLFPEDAREQIDRALRRYASFFGSAARGMWPSEGALSNAALMLAREAGLRWLASDESVLWNSLQKEGRASGPVPPELKFCAYRWGDGEEGPCLFFRDHALSDLFGFTYYHWSCSEAVSDFLNRLRVIHRGLPDDGRNYVVPVILDGENAWEHYPHNGGDFLSLLYGRLAESEEFRTVTFSEFLEIEKFRRPLKSITAGSWIDGNLATWVGHPEKNRAWEELGSARRFWSSSRLGQDNPGMVDRAFHEIMIAEGSDWFWWYGDDHQTENAAEFDALFRGHLKNVYQFLGSVPPAGLEEPIKKAGVGTRFRNPVHTITPQIDGIDTDYFEWLSAGFAVPAGGESMHRTDRFFERVFFGFDLKYFYLRIDAVDEKLVELPTNYSVQVQFIFPKDCTVSLRRNERGEWVCETLHWPVPDHPPLFAGKKILELGVPIEALGVRVREPVEVAFFVLALENEREVERFPSTGFLKVLMDPWGLDQQEWMV